MNISPFDNTHVDSEDRSLYYQAVKLENELLPKPARTWIDIQGNRHDEPAKKGIHIRTCTPEQIKGWLNDKSIKKSQSSLMTVHRYFAVRFPTEYARLRDVIDGRFKREFERVQSEAHNEVEWFGEVGYQNLVRLDGSLTNSRSKVIRLNNDRVKIVRR